MVLSQDMCRRCVTFPAAQLLVCFVLLFDVSLRKFFAILFACGGWNCVHDLYNHVEHMDSCNDLTNQRRESVVDQEIADALTVFSKALDRREWAAAAVERKSFRAADELAEATTAVAHTGAALSAAEAKYEGWSRFFIVANVGGHIHRKMECSTCYPTTNFGWLPNLSGLTEAEAVEEWGSILCSVCFPDAPVEWTDGENKKDAAEKAFKKAIAEISRTPEGKKVKAATELVARKASIIRQCQSTVDRLQETIEEYSDNDSYNADGGRDRDLARISQEQVRIAKTERQLDRAQAKLASATEALELALEGN